MKLDDIKTSFSCVIATYAKNLAEHAVRQVVDDIRVRPRLRKTDSVRRLIAKQRRDDLRARGLCINGASHGKPARGSTKCRRCVEVHRKSS